MATLAAELRRARPELPAAAFTTDARTELQPLPLLARIGHVAAALRRAVPADGAAVLLIVENDTDSGREMHPLPLPFLGVEMHERLANSHAGNLDRTGPRMLVRQSRLSRDDLRFGVGVHEVTFRVNVRWVTPLGEETASTS